MLAWELDTFQSDRQRWDGELDTSPLATEIHQRLEALGYVQDQDRNDAQAP